MDNEPVDDSIEQSDEQSDLEIKTNRILNELEDGLEAVQAGLQGLTEGEGIWEDRVKLRRFNAEIEAIRVVAEWLGTANPEEETTTDLDNAKASAYQAIERFCNGIGVN